MTRLGGWFLQLPFFLPAARGWSWQLVVGSWQLAEADSRRFD